MLTPGHEPVTTNLVKAKTGTVQEICSSLAQVTKNLRAGKTTIERAKLHLKLTGQIMDTYKIEIECAKLYGTKPKAEKVTAVKLLRDERRKLNKEIERLRESRRSTPTARRARTR